MVSECRSFALHLTQLDSRVLAVFGLVARQGRSTLLLFERLDLKPTVSTSSKAARKNGSAAC
jgi:hypothetical protein